MNRRTALYLSLPLVFIVGAIAGAQRGPVPKAAPLSRPANSPSTSHETAVTKASEDPPVLESRQASPAKFTPTLGQTAKSRYLDELQDGKLDSDSLWTVFRCGGEALNTLLLERLTEGVADKAEREAIFDEVDRFTLVSEVTAPLHVDDNVINRAQALALSRTPIDRSIAAKLLSTRDVPLSHQTLWRMGSAETEPSVQLAIVESLARVAPPTLETYNQTVALVHSYAGKGKTYPNNLFGRLITAQMVIKKKCEEAYLKENPGMRR